MSVYDDEYDPLAPPAAGEQPTVEEPKAASPFADDDSDASAAPVADDSPVLEDEPLGEESDGGFSDSEGIVRIWVEDGRLERVRISPVWYHRLTGKNTLASCFRQAFMIASLRIQPEVAAPERREIRVQNVPAISQVTIAAFADVFKDQERRFNEALERRAAMPPQKPTLVEGRSKGVTVKLNRHGWADSVEFDEKWLDDAQVGAICTHVQLAAEAAYAKYEPVEPENTELDDLTTEREILRAAYTAMLTTRRNS